MSKSPHPPPHDVTESKSPGVATAPARSAELAAEQSREIAVENEERQRRAAEELARLQALARYD